MEEVKLQEKLQFPGEKYSEQKLPKEVVHSSFLKIITENLQCFKNNHRKCINHGF